MISVFRLVALLSAMVCSQTVNAEIPSAYWDVARTKGVPVDILYAIALTESQYGYKDKVGNQTFTGPWPWSLNINGSSFRYQNRTEAYQGLKAALDQGQSVDAGIMQISVRWHRQRFDSVWALLDPYTNLVVGADILLERYKKTADWWVAVGAYHAPGKDKASLQRAELYRQRVKKQWLLII